MTYNVLTKTGKLKKVITKKLLRILGEQACKPYCDRILIESYFIDIGLPPKNTDLVVGDTILWIEPEFTGSFKNARFDGYTYKIGEIVKDSYGSKKAQHTFTIKLDNGEKVMKKGRTIMKEYSTVLKQADNREASLDEKHKRGISAKKDALEKWLNNNEESHPSYDEKTRKYHALISMI